MLQSLFSTLLNMSLTASVVIAAVLALRLLLRKAPRAISYALWAVVLFRLLCPVSLPSAASLFSLLDRPGPGDRRADQPHRICAGDPPASRLVPTELPEAPIFSDAAPEAEPLTLEDALPWIWLAGAAAMVLWPWPVSDGCGGSCGPPRPWAAGSTWRTALPRPLCWACSDPGSISPRPWSPGSANTSCSTSGSTSGGWIISSKLLAYGALCLHWFNPLVWVALSSGRTGYGGLL